MLAAVSPIAGCAVFDVVAFLKVKSCGETRITKRKTKSCKIVLPRGGDA